jgi:hypothetical protein
MYAAVVSVSIDEAVQDSAEASLKEEIVPMVKSAPGFVAGYWLAPEDGKATSMVLFDTEEQARATAPPAGSSPMEGVTVTTVEFRPVAASA